MDSSLQIEINDQIKHDQNSIKFQFIHNNKNHTFTEFKVLGNFQTFDQLPQYKNKK